MLKVKMGKIVNNFITKMKGTILETRTYVWAILFISFIFFVFAAILLSFIDHSKSCFTTTPPDPNTPPDTNIGFLYAGASVILISGLVIFIMCCVILWKWDHIKKQLTET